MAIEARSEAPDGADALSFHGGDVERVSSREPGAAQEDVLGALHVGAADLDDVVDDAEEGIEGGLDGVAAADGTVAPPIGGIGGSAETLSEA